MSLIIPCIQEGHYKNVIHLTCFKRQRKKLLTLENDSDMLIHRLILGAFDSVSRASNQGPGGLGYYSVGRRPDTNLYVLLITIKPG